MKTLAASWNGSISSYFSPLLICPSGPYQEMETFLGTSIGTTSALQDTNPRPLINVRFRLVPGPTLMLTIGSGTTIIIIKNSKFTYKMF